jgi:hypothetical protein
MRLDLYSVILRLHDRIAQVQNLVADLATSLAANPLDDGYRSDLDAAQDELGVLVTACALLREGGADTDRPSDDALKLERQIAMVAAVGQTIDELLARAVCDALDGDGEDR